MSHFRAGGRPEIPRHLFIGGPAHGRLLPVDSTVNNWVVPVPTAFDLSFRESMAFRTETYSRRVVGRRDGSTAHVFAAPGCDDDEWLQDAFAELGRRVAFGEVSADA